jgi:OHCU decarboxylase
MSLADRLNEMDERAAIAALVRCCASPTWVAAMNVARPFVDDESVMTAAGDIWRRLGRADWLEAFAAHPKIGDIDSLRAKFAASRQWSSEEQAGVDHASEATLRRLAELNSEYERKFGYIFIVCATGKTADELLAILAGRLPNDPAAELPIAAEEQLKITLVRLKKLDA